MIAKSKQLKHRELFSRLLLTFKQNTLQSELYL